MCLVRHVDAAPAAQVEGITLAIMEAALRQAAEGRRHILQQMGACSPAPRGFLGPYAPRIRKITVRRIQQSSRTACTSSTGLNAHP